MMAVMASIHPVSSFELRSFWYIKSTLKASLLCAASAGEHLARKRIIFDSEDNYV